MKKLFLVISLACAMFSCSSPIDRKFSKETAIKDLEDIRKTGKYDSTEVQILAQTVAGAMILNIGSLGDQTYAQILEAGKASAKAKKDLQDKLIKAVMVSVSDKQFANNQVFFKVNINAGDKDVVKYRGKFKVFDKFGDLLVSLPGEFEENLKAGSKKESLWNHETNQFSDSDKKLANTPISDLKFEWEPEYVYFADGTKLKQD